ncbi:pentatricopeptide repeat-containing protein At4g37170-like [Cryptomeria japonica]|uniref:pentatricopeptide repeat-containing protein At4g37170-like n=1 Tax=Cryptomeria japonica TaxID=3369 RepID=UPI0027D9E33C|nr:pentatricopeptide repeat-containing protein At4g37170-like [Cryptomeria japonica]
MNKISHSSTQFNRILLSNYLGRHARSYKLCSTNYKDEQSINVDILCKQGKLKEAIGNLCKKRQLRRAVDILCQSGFNPDVTVYATLLQGCIDLKSLKEGKRVHSHIISEGCKQRVYLWNRLIDMYAKCGSLDNACKVFDKMLERDICSWNTAIGVYLKNGKIDYARKLFDEIPTRDEFSWSTIIAGYVQHGLVEEALDVFRRMQENGGESSKYTIASVLSACARVVAGKLGSEVHGHIIRTGGDYDVFVWSGLVDMYAKCGRLDKSCQVFEKMHDRDVVSWTVMIGRLVQSGRGEKALNLFSQMQMAGMKPNQFTFASLLSACAMQSALELGKQAHGHIIRSELDESSFVESALVDMYAKCGNVERAWKVFKKMPNADLVSWSAMIAGYAQHGLAKEALDLFEKMLSSGTKPDHVVFIGVLCACTHAGLVDQGRHYFESMRHDYGIEPVADHYVCMIDLLGRAGRLDEAEDLLNKMPFEPDVFLWSALLSACKTQGNIELGERAAENLFKLEPENPATYITLSHIYATAGRWDDATKVRKMMEDRGVKKKPGRSWIEVKDKVHTFMVEDRPQSQAEVVYAMLDDRLPYRHLALSSTTRLQHEKLLQGIQVTTIPKTNFALYDFKDVRFSQFIVKLKAPGLKLEIVRRDSNHFHHFRDGCCSCGDFW